MIRRRNYLIKKRFQLNFLYRFTALLVLEAVLIAGFFFYASNNTLTTGYVDSVLKVERTSRFFLVPALFIISMVGVGMAIAGMLVFIFLSHRIAGPLYRFEKALKEAEGGDLTKRIDLRKSDQLAELKEAMNVFVGSLDRRVSKMKRAVEEAELLLSKKDDPEAVAKLKSTLAGLRDEIRHFRVTPGFKE